MSKKHYVFVYGTLRQNQSNHARLSRNNAVFVTKGKTNELFNMRHTGIPFVSKTDSDENDTNIVGEVFEVDEETLLGPLDGLEGHPFVYKRELTTINGDNGESYDAWLYFYTHNGRGTALPTGDFLDR